MPIITTILHVLHTSPFTNHQNKTMSDKLQRTIARFQQKIDNKDFYEAHQTLRTITNRYVKTSQYPEAIDLLYQGLSILATNKEYGSASDLILYLIQVYGEAKIKCSNEAASKDYKWKLIDLISLLPDSDPSLGDVAKNALAWSKESSLSKFGDADLHHLFGSKFLKAIDSQTTEDEKYKLFAVAELHLILGTYESLPIYVDYLFSWYQEGGKSGDAGEFIARAVINYAYLKNIKFALSALERFLSKYVASDVESYSKVDDLYMFEKLEVLNFVQLLLATLTKVNSGEKYLKLYQHYKQLLVSAGLAPLVEYLGRFYFGLNLGNPQGGNNMLANLMGGLFK